MYKSDVILNKVYDNNDFNIITINETLAIQLKLSNKTILTLATIYCPDGKPDRKLFRTGTSFSDKVILLGDFNSNHKVFNCATTTTSGRNLKGHVEKLKLTYLNNDEHSHLDAHDGTTDILDMAFATSSLKSRDIRFSFGESLEGDHFSIGIFLDRPLQRNIATTSSRYQFVKADVNMFQNKMGIIFNSRLFYSFTPKASDMAEYQKYLVDSLKEATDTSIPKVDCHEKLDMVTINIKLIKENVNSDDSMPSKNCRQPSHPSISCRKK